MSWSKTTKKLTGNTYAHRDDIREIGGWWDAARKCWVVRMGSMRQRALQSAVLARLSKLGVRVEAYE